MSYKKYWKGLVSCVVGLLCTTLLISYLIDPIGMWGAPIIQGFNHYKWYAGYLDVCKPYEYIHEKPDILYIGASALYVGFEPICRTHPEKKVYMMGLSALSLQHMREYLRFVYKVHKPEVIYMGLTPVDFGSEMYYRKRNGYSETRLEQLTGNFWNYWGQLIKDSFSLHNRHWLTISSSQLYKAEKTPFHLGWDVQRGTAQNVSPKRYYDSIWLLTEPNYWKYVPESMECLQDIVYEAREAGVPLIAFFVPFSVDRYATVELIGRGPDFRKWKQKAAEILPIYDFAVVNELATDRQAYFFDAAHFRVSLGEKLKLCLENDSPEPYGYLLTAENADAVFEKENVAWEKWKADNQDYVNELKECIETGHWPEVGEFKRYIGF